MTADGEPTLGQLVTSAGRELSALVRAEIALAKAELRDDARHAARGGALFGAAGYLALLASVLLSVALAHALTALGLHPGWAFLLVGLAYLLVAGALALVGLRVVRQIRPPERAVASARRMFSRRADGSTPATGAERSARGGQHG